MQRLILYSMAVVLVGASACIAWSGFIHAFLPDQFIAFPILAAGAALAITTWRIDNSPETE